MFVILISHMYRILLSFLCIGFVLPLIAQERIYIHYDRAQYSAGDTIWFKAYFYNNGKPSFASKNFYLQLVDLNGKKIAEQHYVVIGGSVNGGIALSDTLKQSYYVVRAFTPESIGYEEAFIYKKILPLQQRSIVRKKTGSLLANFVADGNVWPLGVETSIFAYTRSAGGAPVSVKGVIKDEKDSIVQQFTSDEYGIAQFNLKAINCGPYRASIIWNNESHIYELPRVDSTGIGLNVRTEGNGFEYRIMIGKHLAIKDTLLLSVKQKNQLLFYKEYVLQKELGIQGRVNFSNADAGFFECVLENKNGKVLASRTIFAIPEKIQTTVEIKPEQLDFAAHALNKFNLIFPDTIPRSYSVSVTADSNLNDSEQQEWVDYRLLLPGFLKEDLNALQHDYARFFSDTNGISQLNRVLAFYKPHRFISEGVKAADPYLISTEGTVYNNKNTGIMSGGSLKMLMVNDGKQLLIETPVSTTGRFKVDSLIFFGDARIYYTYYNEKGRTLSAKIRVDSTERDFRFNQIPYYKQLYASLIDTGNLNRPVFAPATGTTLKEVTVFTKIKKPTVADRYVSDRFKNDGKVLFDMTQTLSRPTLDQLIRVKLPSLYIKQEGPDEYKLLTKTYYGLSQLTGQWEVDIYLDEYKVRLQDVLNINLEDIALIKYNTVGFPIGALFIYLKKAEDRAINLPSRTQFFDIKGYSPILTYNPVDYEEIDKSNPISDKRKTLLWKPDIYVHSVDAKPAIIFYNNDQATSFLITVEGMDLKGRLFKKQLRVQK